MVWYLSKRERKRGRAISKREILNWCLLIQKYFEITVLGIIVALAKRYDEHM